MHLRIHLPTKICHLKINTQILQWSLAVIYMHRVEKILSCQLSMLSAEVEQGNTLPSCFSSQTVNKCPFLQQIQCHFFNVFMPFVGDLLLKMAPKFSAEELSSVSKYKKNVIPYKENTCIGKASFRCESQSCWP